MIAQSTASPAARRSPMHRWVRQVHLWIGAWGAIAAIVYGFTGPVMNHRFGDNAWPQGSSAPSGSLMLEVPAAAQATPEALTGWLSDAHGLSTQRVRKAAARHSLNRRLLALDGSAFDPRALRPASPQLGLF